METFRFLKFKVYVYKDEYNNLLKTSEELVKQLGGFIKNQNINLKVVS
jgi:hypothetical protein